MTVEQWGIRVPAREGETTRRALIDEGALDLSLKVRRDGDALLLPLLDWREGAEQCQFEQNPERVVLPRHELVGGIAIIQENDPVGAQKILDSRPSLHTIVYAKGEVSGEYRTREFEVIAGVPTTRTEVIEYGHRFHVDLEAAYFSARLSSERQRILEQTGRNETVLDMFAGVGPFAITLAARAALVVACDLNPRAVELMLENIAQNRTTNVLPVLADARRLAGIFPWRFDRIVMNLPLSGTEFLQDAFRLCKPGGTIHFYSLVSAEGEHRECIGELGGEVLAERVVRSYSPGQWHAVYDICVKCS
ncbi:MAG: methyltransferase [Methanomicrobiales archaeon HGW-Methanomicrobiales-1]|jgi:tRNA (guanine37-N1)-methyltransferase|nr:MAG: methyltransferase [Methanomicrobiales archaeon HGW-Methanomicrobiales-1]